MSRNIVLVQNDRHMRFVIVSDRFSWILANNAYRQLDNSLLVKTVKVERTQWVGVMNRPLSIQFSIMDFPLLHCSFMLSCHCVSYLLNFIEFSLVALAVKFASFYSEIIAASNRKLSIFWSIFTINLRDAYAHDFCPFFRNSVATTGQKTSVERQKLV